MTDNGITLVFVSYKSRYAASIIKEGRARAVTFKVENSHIMFDSVDLLEKTLVLLPEFHRDPEDFEGYPTLTSTTMSDVDAREALRKAFAHVEIEKW